MYFSKEGFLKKILQGILMALNVTLFNQITVKAEFTLARLAGCLAFAPTPFLILNVALRIAPTPSSERKERSE